MDEVFRALSDPSRRRLLDSLNSRNGQSLRELCAGLEMARQSVSKHLVILEDANLVTTVWRGREKLHYLNAAPINEIAERWINHYDQPRVTALSDLKKALEGTAMSKPEFVYTTYINTTPERLWQGLTDPAFTRRYWGGVAFESDWRAGSTFTLELAQHGVKIADPAQVVLESDPYRRLSYTWHTFTPEWAAAYGVSDEHLTRGGQRAALQGDLRHRAGRGDGQADRHPRRLRCRQRGARGHLNGLAADPVRPQDAARNRRHAALDQFL